MRAERLLWAASTAPAAAAAAYVAGCWPLLALGVLRPWVALLVGAPLALAALVLVARSSMRRATPVGWLPVVLVLLVSVGFGICAALWSSENVVLRRDPGSYALTARWIADHGSREIPVEWAAFGGRDPALSAASPAYFPAGDELVPQFLSGAPLTFAAGEWVAGMHGLLLVPALTGALGVLALGGLATRLIGGWGGVLAAAGLAVSFPVLHAARSTYSEPLALLVLIGGLGLLVDAAYSQRRSWRLALVAGLVLGLATVVRVEALREVALLIPVAALLASQRRREGPALALGLALGTAVGVADGLLLAFPYLEEVRDSLVPLAGLTLLMASAGVVVAVVLARRGGLVLPAPILRVLPALAVAGVLLPAAGLAVRPHVQLGKQDPVGPGGRAVRALQFAEHLPLDGSRTYAEQTPHWVVWWVGAPAVALAVLGLAWLGWRTFARRHPLPAAGPVLLVLAASAVLVLLRPGITPDHPWADRRLVPSVFPLVALGAAAGVVALGRRPLVFVAGALAVLVPAAMATKPLLRDRTEHGELAAVQAACADLRPTDVVFLLDLRARREWSQPLRGICGVPTVGVLDRTALPRLAQRARSAGSTPVVAVGGFANRITEAGATPEHVVHLVTWEDARTLSTRPRTVVRLPVDLWIARL